MYRDYPKFRPYELLEYFRKSRSDDPSLTVEEVLHKHESILNDWQERNLDAPVPEENIYREVVSGETINSRPEFKKLLKRIESAEIKAVLVVECARLGRPDLEEIGKLSKLFRYTGTYIVTPQRIFDLRDEYDRESFEREMMRGADYLEYTKKILGRGKEVSLRQGYFVSGVIPYGYERDWIYEGKRKRPTLAIVEDEAEIVRLIFDWYANEGIGATKICQRLNEMAVKPKKGDIWKKSSITNMLKNEHYLGKIVIKKHIDVNMVEDSTITTHCVFNPDYEIVDGKHPAIIDEVTFYKANNKLHKYPSVRPSATLQNPFASILKCECGKTMIRRRNRNTFRYLCDEQQLCGNSSVSEKELVKSAIQHLTKSLNELTVNVSSKDDKEKEKHEERISLIESKLFALEKKELALWDKYAEEGMPKEVFDTLLSKCTSEKKTLEKALKTAQSTMPKTTDQNDKIASLQKAIKSLKEDKDTAEEKNKLLLTVCEKIVYKRVKPTRYTDEEAAKRGVKTINGWYSPKFELDVYLHL